MDTIDFAWGMYLENAEQARHHESQRSSAATAIVGLVGGIVGSASAAPVGGMPLKLLGACIAVLGLLGTLLALKHYERNRHHVAYMKRYRRAVEDALGGAVLRVGAPTLSRATTKAVALGFRAIRDEAKASHSESVAARLVEGLPLFSVYTAANVLVVVLGLLLLLSA